LPDSSTPYSSKVLSTSDGYGLSYREYSSSGPERARIVAIHGIQSHAGWYEGSCQALAHAGCGVMFLDRRGSGANQVARGDTPGYRRLVDDLAEFIQLARSQRPQKVPLILMAISWGGKLAVALQERHPNLIDGLILITPGFFPRVSPRLGEKLRIALARVFRPGKLFPIPLNDPELFTSDPRWLDFLRKDERSLHLATARFLVSSVHLDRQLPRAARSVRVPTLLLLAGKDRIIDNDRTRRFVESFPVADRQITEYPGRAHTLEFEDPQKLERNLTDWVHNHAGRNALE
jgi:alpha-beta hydrolase superfamily lysophospholipase